MILMAVVMPEATANQVLMGFDYGEARIGVGTGNTLLKIAHPLTTVTGEGMWNKIDQLEELIKKWQPQLLVVGIPSASDDPQKIQLINTINNFAKRLKRKFNLPVTLITEDFSSADAAMLLEEQAIYGKAQKGKLDQLAACAILQTYFSEIR
ncbi:MAG: Holliday junction resolvase RuvX [Neisseriales bacterium]|nr:MAG: Holliday junction resolvase RuvX [Neisseriales bacterium]